MKRGFYSRMPESSGGKKAYALMMLGGSCGAFYACFHYLKQGFLVAQSGERYVAGTLPFSAMLAIFVIIGIIAMWLAYAAWQLSQGRK